MFDNQKNEIVTLHIPKKIESLKNNVINNQNETTNIETNQNIIVKKHNQNFKFVYNFEYLTQ